MFVIYFVHIMKGGEKMSVDIMTVKEVAELLKASESSVRMRVYRGQLPARRLGGRIIFIKQELERYIKNLPPAVKQAKPSK